MSPSVARVSIGCILLLIAACRGDLLTPSDPLPLEGTNWRLDHVETSGDISEPPVDEIYSIFFDTTGVLLGRSDCNDCLGSFHLRKSDTLVLSFGCTEAACRPSGSAIGHFPIYASGVFGYHINDETLTLNKDQSAGTLRLVFEGRQRGG